VVNGRYKMRNTKYEIRNTLGLRSKYGFTLAELLLALSITALLVAAAAVAIDGSAKNYQENKDIFNAVNTARQALTRMTRQLRTAQSVSTADPNSQCSFITAGGSDITYRFDSGNQELYLDDNDANSSNLLCDNVTDMIFTRQTATEGAVTYVTSVQISITVSAGNNQKTVSAAAVIRKNLR